MLIKRQLGFIILFLCACFITLVFYSPRIWGDQKIFLCIPEQKGSVTQEGFQDCIALVAYNQTFGNKNNVCKISFVKRFDPASAYFAIQAITNNTISEGTFHFYSNAGLPETLLTVEFVNWRVKKVQGSAETGEVAGVLSETVQLLPAAGSRLMMTKLASGEAPVVEEFECI